MDSDNKHKHHIRASDAVAWSSCIRRAWLDITSDRDPETPIDEFEKLVMDMGLRHEASVLDSLKETKRVEVAQSVTHTAELMAAKTEVIYQAQLRDDVEGFIGFPDFLILADSGNYQAADAKLSLNEEKKEIQVQLAFYRRLLGNNEVAKVYLGDGSEATIGDEADKTLDKFIEEMRLSLASGTEPNVRYSHSKCRACPYYEHCTPNFEKREEISLLYGIQGRAVDGLEKSGITTISDLSTKDTDSVPDVPYLKGADKKYRAILQAKSYFSGEVFQLSPVVLPEGSWIHFDIEDNPLTNSGEKHVYLWGFLVPDYNDTDFEYVWTDEASQDKDGWLAFLAKIESYRNQYSDLILAHYSAHERSTIKGYAKRYDMEDDATVQYLLGDDSPLFDMQKPVLDNLVLPLQGYGLKDICKHKGLVNFQWEDESSGSQWSVVQFNRFLDETNPTQKEHLKNQILGYNRDDVIATRKLEEWLREKFMA